MLDLSVLRKALAPLSKIGKEELTFDVKGTQVTIRPLLPAEEVVVQRYSAEVIEEHRDSEGKSEDDNMSRAAALDYFDRFRTEVLAHSLVQVGDLDLRNVDKIATGEFLEDGTPMQIPRYVAMRIFIKEQWSRGMLSLAFYKYGELAQRLQLDADNLARKSMADMDVEIERLEKRLEEVKEERSKRAAGDVNITSKQITAILEAEDALDRSAQNVIDSVPVRPPVAPTPRPEQPAPIAPQVPPVPTQTPARKPVMPASSPPPGGPTPQISEKAQAKFRSSFDDSDDAILEEEQRILSLRRQAMLSESVVDPLRGAQPVGPIDKSGSEAFKLPPQVLSARGKNQQEKQPVPEINAIPRGTANPNFRPNR